MASGCQGRWLGRLAQRAFQSARRRGERRLSAIGGKALASGGEANPVGQIRT